MPDIASGTISTAAPTPPVKPGWKTSEFYLTLLVNVIGTLMESKIIGDGGQVAQIAAAALMLLATYGYTYHRAQLKAGAA